MRHPVLLGLFALLFAGCSNDSAPPEVATPAQGEVASEERPAERLSGFALEADVASQKVARAEHATRVAPQSAAAWRRLAYALTTRDRLLHSHDDLTHATKALETARALAPDDPETALLAAHLLQKTHRFRDALDAVEHLPATPTVRATRASLRFELGDYGPAIEELEQLTAMGRPNPNLLSRLALCRWKTGDFEAAEATMALAQKHFHGRERWPAAWYHLMLGLMDLDRGRLDEAMAHYRDAEAETPGWWLIEEHMAEIHLLQGRPDQALPLYRKVVAETGSAELIGALADALEATGNMEAASIARQRALSTVQHDIDHHGAMASGHALGFLLEHGDPERALALARENVALRPNGEALLLLADALDKVEQHDEAGAVRSQVEASGWWMGTDQG